MYFIGLNKIFMPIPSLKNSKNQSWRIQKKKYFLGRSNSSGYSHNKNLGNTQRKIYRSSQLLSPELKKKILIGLGVLFLISILTVIILVFQISRSLPDPNRLIEREIAQSTKIYDRTGENILYEIHGDQQRTLVNLSDIPEHLKWATIAIEDKNFYEHKGISFLGIFRGVIWQTIRGKKAQGGSTLTQQFIKNSILTSERTITRKIKEWLLAYKLENRFSKDEILQMYFNEIPYGSTAYGVEAASQKYFGKTVKEINLAEAAILAALPQGPSRYSPYGPNIDLLLGRQQYILDLMVEQGHITKEEAEEAKNYELTFKPQSANIKAPHFVMYVKDILSSKYGEKMVEQGGLKIITTLDLYKQEIAEEVVKEQAEKNLEKYNASNAALISIDPKTGQILCMVGSKDYFNQDIDGQVNITTSKRQPGSSLKPLVYATAFIKGYTPNTILYDVITNFSSDPAKSYEPHNYDNAEHGPVSIRKALAGSLNVPAVKAIYLAGIKNVTDLAFDLGYTTLTDTDRFGLSLVLGGGEVKLIEHANAYSAFAREGVQHPISAILKVEKPDGTVLEEFKDSEKKVIDPKIARQINDILSDNNARAYVFGERNWLTLGSRPVAAKTGTTNDYRDAWTMGYTPSIVTGVWVGNNDNSEMKRGADGGVVAAPIWHNFMDKVLGDTPIEKFNTPEIPTTGKAVLDGTIDTGNVIKIDKISGLLATEYTPKDLIIEKSFSQPHSILYYVDKNDPLGSAPKNPEQDPQFLLWEEPVLKWAEKQRASSTVATEDSQPPTESDNIHVPENIPTLKFISPTNNQTVLEPVLFSRIEASATRGISRIEYYINGNLFYTTTEYPYSLAKQIDFLKNGFHNLKVKACDDVENCSEKEVEFNLILENNNNKTKATEASIISPQNGTAITNIDFPLSFEISLNEPKQVANITLYSINVNDEKNIINTIYSPFSNTNPIIWEKTPPSETYRIFAEVSTWTKELVKTKEITLTVNNIETKKETP